MKKGPDSEWINTVLKKGTIADRLAAHTLLIHESKNFSSLNVLIDLVDPKKCRRQCIMAMTTLKELFLESLNLSQPNCQIKLEEDKQKVRFYYTRFIDQLSLVAFDNLEETRKKAIWVLSELLNKQSENKEYILEKLIDKMGDKVPKLASTAGHLVEKSINSEREETRLKAIKQIQRFLNRPNQSSKARYYAISLLTRIKFIKGSHEMANEMMQTYLSLYMTLTKEKNIESRLMSAILVGINRAYPYSRLNNDIFEQHLQTLYTLVHRVNFRMAVIAMILIKNIVCKRAELLKIPIEDRFYNLIFGQIIRPDLQACSRHQAFAGLLLNTINEDKVLARKEAFIKRILQVAINSRPELAQILLSTVTKINGFNSILRSNTDDEDDVKPEVVDSSSEDDEDDEEEKEDDADSGSPKAVGWVHRPRKSSNKFDPLARNPRSAKPNNLNELYLLRQHCAPEVVKLAQLITGESKN